MPLAPLFQRAWRLGASLVEGASSHVRKMCRSLTATLALTVHKRKRRTWFCQSLTHVARMKALNQPMVCDVFSGFSLLGLQQVLFGSIPHGINGAVCMSRTCLTSFSLKMLADTFGFQFRFSLQRLSQRWGLFEGVGNGFQSLF